jgi:hypothetical protein
MRKLGSALLIVMCGVSVATTSSAWAIDRCRDQVLSLKQAEQRVTKMEKKIDSAENRVDGAINKKASAKERGETLIANAELQATNARAISAAVTTQCATNVLIGLIFRKPGSVSINGRQFSCAAGSVRNLITRITQAEALEDRAERKAAALLDRAQKYLERMVERLEDYQKQLPPLVATRDQEKADLAQCRADNPA